MRKKLSWHLATRQQLYQIIYDEPCSAKDKLEAKLEIERRSQAKRANVKWRAMGRNWG